MYVVKSIFTGFRPFWLESDDKQMVFRLKCDISLFVHPVIISLFVRPTNIPKSEHQLVTHFEYVLYAKHKGPVADCLAKSMVALLRCVSLS